MPEPEVMAEFVRDRHDEMLEPLLRRQPGKEIIEFAGEHDGAVIPS
jgi:hypothetical protein